MPRVKGGLGLRKTEAINKAFQCKLARKILTNEDSIWVRVMRAKYLKQQNFLLCPKKASDSPVWKSILSCRPLLRKGMVWKVGNGNEISFLYDNWIEDQSLIQLLGIDNNPILDPNAKVSEFIRNALWDIQKLNQTLQNHQIIQKIIGIALPVIETEDSFCLGLNGSGFFTIKSATWLVHGNRVSQQQSWQYKWIWNIDTMPQIKVFMW